MRYILKILLLLPLLQTCEAQVEKSSAAQVDLKPGQQYNFEAIAEAVADKKIIALGESSHGIGDYYAFKAELVQYLHEHHGFEVLAFEAGLGDLNLAWSSIDSLSGIELMNQTIFGNFRCEEIHPLFNHIKQASHSKQPLNYTGFDNQLSSSYFQKTIQPIIGKYDKDLSDSLEHKLQGYVRWFRAGYYQDSIKYEKEAADFTSTSKKIQGLFSVHRSDIQANFSISDSDIKVINQTCLGFIRTVELPYAQRQQGSANRDAIMFDNFQWLVQELYPNKKIIIWAHNAHIEQETMYENGTKWMGHYLAEEYGDDYYTLGLFALEGEAYQQWGDTIVSLDNKHVDHLEAIIMKSGHSTSFLNLEKVDTTKTTLQWTTKNVNGFENENGGQISFIPKNRFDGIVVFRKVKAPSY